MILDLDELERLAKAATPGPWEYKPGFADWNMPMFHSIEARGLAILEIEGRMPSPIGGSPKEHQRFADAAYVAAANPQAVLALLERLRDLEGELAAWKSGETQPGFACGRIAELDATFVGGCGLHVDMLDSYRCADCTASFHRACLRKHFEAEPKSTARLTLEQLRRIWDGWQASETLSECCLEGDLCDACRLRDEEALVGKRALQAAIKEAKGE